MVLPAGLALIAISLMETLTRAAWMGVVFGLLLVVGLAPSKGSTP